MDIRRLEAADAPIVRMKAEALAAGYYPEMVPSIDREHELLTELRTNTHHYARVVGKPGEPEAALVAKTGTNLWAMQKHATILLWYSERPGAGIALLRDFREWVKTQKGVILAGFMDDYGVPVKLAGILHRESFKQRGGAYVYFPGGSFK